MTTNAQHTPWDSRIHDILDIPTRERNIAEAGDLEEDLLRRDGYLLAKAEDADLLAAAEWVKRWAKEHPWQGLYDASNYNDGVGMLTALDAAIAKAKGEA